MYTRRDIPLLVILTGNIIPTLIYASYLAAVILIYLYLTELVAIPLAAVSIIGIAVAFYLGFKNNASNERLNDARKNWGVITNESRSYVAMMLGYVPTAQLDSIREIVKGHIAWLYCHSYFLRFRRMEWEHNLAHNETYRTHFIRENQIPNDPVQTLGRFLPQADVDQALSMANPSTFLLQRQTLMLKKLVESGVITEFQHIELQNQISKFYTCQGVNERIKTYPFQRQYANFAKIFVNIFHLTLPLGLISAFETKDAWTVWLMLPVSLLTFMVFHMMEMLGDYSENPFEGLINDVPITSITRNIEIDMLQMIGEKEVPAPITSKNGVIM